MYSTAPVTDPTVHHTITVQLLTGYQLAVDVHSNHTYLQLYQSLWEQMPIEIRPETLDQMNLLLEGELVPLSHVVAEVSQEMYYLLLDTIWYEVIVRVTSHDAVNHNHPMEKTYSVLQWTIKTHYSTEEKEIYLDTLLYDNDIRRYYSIQTIPHEWATNRYGENKLHLWIEPYHCGMSDIDIVHYIVNHCEHLLCPSLAGKRSIQDQLEAEFTTFEETYPS